LAGAGEIRKTTGYRGLAEQADADAYAFDQFRQHKQAVETGQPCCPSTTRCGSLLTNSSALPKPKC
jgi:hypothetical protein